MQRFLHFTTWTVRDEHLNVSRPAMESETNYWQRTMDGTKQPPPPPLPPEFAVQAAIFMKAKLAAEMQKELFFEKVRGESYPERPSRARCIFLFEDGPEALDRMKAMGFSTDTRSLIEVELDASTGSLHRADFGLLNCNALVGNESALSARAHAYWRGDGAVPERQEILWVGPYRILRVVEPALTPPGG